MLVAALALVAFAATARAQSFDNGAAPPVAPIAPVPPAAGASAPAPELAPARLAPPAGVEGVGAQAKRGANPQLGKPARVPLAKRWWFWAGLGAAAVGVVLAAIFLGPRDPYNGNTSPGTVEIF
jgi:hypothetical protein